MQQSKHRETLLLNDDQFALNSRIRPPLFKILQIDCFGRTPAQTFGQCLVVLGAFVADFLELASVVSGFFQGNGVNIEEDG